MCQVSNSLFWVIHGSPGVLTPFPLLTWSRLSRYFSRKDGFMWEQQRIAVCSHGKPCASLQRRRKENSYRGWILARKGRLLPLATGLWYCCSQESSPSWSPNYVIEVSLCVNFLHLCVFPPRLCLLCDVWNIFILNLAYNVSMEPENTVLLTMRLLLWVWVR